ncbi:polysaccharide deacetylase family protein [Nostoc sp. TCL26-01]|nr:polysaccharide deacetylase family protein [Nostoc sp. TCL26-01]
MTSQNLPATLALVSLISFAAINFKYTKPTVPILGFHGILDGKKQNIHVPVDTEEMHYSQQEMEKLLEYLIINNYWFLTTQDLYDFFLTKNQDIPYEYRTKKPIMLSFDDGYKSVHTKLLPVLLKLEKKYGKKVKIVLFINPGNLATARIRRSTHLSCQELRAGFKAGFYDIQSHGLSHKDLTLLARRELVNEILQARTILRNCTEDLDPEQTVASHFAYPYGTHNKQVELYVSKYYLSGYLYNDEILNYTCQNNYYQISRLIVNYHKTPQQILKNTKEASLINNQQCQ